MDEILQHGEGLMFGRVAEAFPGLTSVRRSGMHPHRRRARGRMPSAARDKRGSTNSAVRNAAEDVLHLARSQFRVNGGYGGAAAQGPVGTLEPTHGALMIAKTFIGDGNDASQTVKPVGL